MLTFMQDGKAENSGKCASHSWGPIWRTGDCANRLRRARRRAETEETTSGFEVEQKKISEKGVRKAKEGCLGRVMGTLELNAITLQNLETPSSQPHYHKGMDLGLSSSVM